MKNNMENLFDKITEDYSMILLNWAYKKLGDTTKAEDLTQEVFVQVFSAINREMRLGNKVEKLDNLVWKIAHYVWCHYLRKETSYKRVILIDDFEIENNSTFEEDYENKQEYDSLIIHMQKQVSMLNYLQREIIIHYYFDELSIKQIAEKFSMSESAVKWHLFNTRNKLKKEISMMENTEYVYRPRNLHMGISGQSVQELDIKMIQNSLSKQNICVACYKEPKTIDALATMLGIPKAYIESDIEWLLEKEFVTENKGKYSTAFMIDTAYEENEKRRIILNHKANFSDVIINELIAAESKIRDIGFYGCDKPMNKMLWMLIYFYNNNARIPISQDELPSEPIRPDGGKYFPLGFDRTDYDKTDKCIDTSNWAYNGSMCSDGFHWFGLYNFGKSNIENLIDKYTDEWRKRNELLRQCIKSEISLEKLDENEKFALSKLIQEGFIIKEEEKLVPNLYVFTKDQYSQLKETVFKPIEEKVSDELIKIGNELREYCKNTIPPQLKNLYGFFVKMALMDIGYITTILAFNDSKLYVPKDKKDGEFLTFAFIEY